MTKEVIAESLTNQNTCRNLVLRSSVNSMDGGFIVSKSCETRLKSYRYVKMMTKRNRNIKIIFNMLQSDTNIMVNQTKTPL